MVELKFENVFKKYNPTDPHYALQGINFSLDHAPFTVITGPSGSGKTTLLNLAAGLDRPDQGKIYFLGSEISSLSPKELSNFRRRNIGFIFQAYNLFPNLTALENIEYGLQLKGIRDSKVAKDALARVGLAGFEVRFPADLSGGQQQRVAVARAIATVPKMVFADEPSANLDSKNAFQLIEIFKQLNEELKVGFVFSTHDARIITSAKQVMQLEDGIYKGH
jgi:putative ABC transport system ATP-binding protein